jgi:predicted Co/Zn/Cd cation transporter (cation efflux family)
LKTEQGVLRISIAVTILLAGIGILFGLLSGSYAIVFDGVYGLTDATMTIVALFVSNLIESSTASGPARSKLVKHFTMGFWHLEPMVLGLNGILLSGAAIYGLINAVGSIMAGGRPLAFDRAIIYAAVTLVIAVAMAIFGRAVNRTIQSDFVTLDWKAWMMSAALSAALLIAFVFGFLIQGSSLEWVSPYIDPAALAGMSGDHSSPGRNDKAGAGRYPAGHALRSQAACGSGRERDRAAPWLPVLPGLRGQGRPRQADRTVFHSADGLAAKEAAGLGPHSRRDR